MKKKLTVLFLMLMMLAGFSTLSFAQENATITVWCWDPNFNIYAMEKAADIYKDINPNVTVDVQEVAWEDIQTRLSTSLSANQTKDLPDIVLMQDNALIKNVSSFPDAFYDLSDSGINFDKFADFKVELTTVDGRNYGVPFDNGAAINAMRVDVLEEAGYTIDDFTDITWKEFIEKGSKVREKTGKPLLSAIAGESDLLMVMLQSTGNWLFDSNGEPYITENEALKEVIRVYQELLKKKILVEVNDWDQYISSFQSGTVAGTMNGAWIIGSIVPVEEQAGDWRITNIPRFGSIEGATNYSSQGGSSWMVMASSKNPELAADFLNQTFAGSKELYETILPSSGALATYLPAGDSEVYNEPHPYFGGQKIYSDITDFASRVPRVKYGIYNYEARDAVSTAITQIMQGQNIMDALNEAQSTVEFQMW
ncbi:MULTISPECIES: ABC transporter substrate-binding protein [Halanaerobium]|uniref:Carbohydrate ABC transporter substrate-binding protein, CUT1 family n=1 Tax=Halanaerobium kushneri TaxID=56779 RepID=A0A1N6QV82_9FIRM|nr:MULTISPECIES: extracellular solute-binding protein [Halanaerobium]RCW61077.1 carbohydrate ABC transporter substrate-binding protein (CUT1 family) [Halanaerobium sp. ST460_2HS_T2]SIQ20493.1 carbohydrate ABC transporter substrate-binding protein, CUT1 family [Halanaerobium kushneri]